MAEQVSPKWRKSSRSGSNGGDCVEVAEQRDRVLIRDSKLGDAGPILAVGRDEFRRFLAGVAPR